MRALIIAAGLALIAPSALAQAPQATRDLAYCERLYDMHERYAIRLARGGKRVRDGMADLAVDRCRNGRFGEGIPVLESKLQDVKVPLPDR